MVNKVEYILTDRTDKDVTVYMVNKVEYILTDRTDKDVTVF